MEAHDGGRLTPGEVRFREYIGAGLRSGESIRHWVWGRDGGEWKAGAKQAAKALAFAALGIRPPWKVIPSRIGAAALALTDQRLVWAASSASREGLSLVHSYHEPRAFELDEVRGRCAFQRSWELLPAFPILRLFVDVDPPLHMGFAKYSAFPDNLAHAEAIAVALQAREL